MGLIELLTYIGIGILLITVVISFIRKSESPLIILGGIAGLLSILSITISLCFKFELFFLILVLLSLITIILNLISNNSERIEIPIGGFPSRAEHRFNPPWSHHESDLRRGAREFDRRFYKKEKSSYQLVALLFIIFLFSFLVIREYFGFKAESESQPRIVEVLGILSVFNLILCITAWLLSFLLGGIIVNEGKSNIASLTSWDIPVSNSIEDLVVQGDLQEALEELEKMAVSREDKKLKKTVVLLKSSLNNIEEDHNSNKTNLEDYQVAKANIGSKILNLIK